MCDYSLQNVARVPPKSVTSWFRHAFLIRSRAGLPRLASRTFRFACRLVPNWRSRRTSNTRPRSASFQKRS